VLILVSGESFWQATVGLLLLAQTAPRCNSKATQMLPKVYLDEGEFPGRRSCAGETAPRFALVQMTLEEPHVLSIEMIKSWSEFDTSETELENSRINTQQSGKLQYSSIKTAWADP